jgi:DNA helicase IV
MRPPDSPWETGDVPLLDEAAELLGVDDEPARLAALRAERESAKELAYARDVAALSGSGMVTADMLVERYAGQRARTSVADAENDRTWTFGHVVVDEAQELSPMAWRVVARRCPSLSMTVVGDVNQTGNPAGVTSWSSVFDVLAKDRWTIETLSVNYRTPRPVMELATAGLRAAGIDAAEVVSARDGDAPRSARIAALAALPVVVHEELHRAGAGRVAVIAAERTAPAVGAVLTTAMPALVGVGDTAVDNRIAVLSPTTAKGLEFDAVVIVNPADVAATEGSGPRDLYVATTRTTAHLLLLDVDDA